MAADDGCSEPRTLQEEVERLRAELQELEAAAAEQDAADAVALHDAQLERLQLDRWLQRFGEQPPGVEDLAERLELEVDELAAEVLRLREENASLAARGALHAADAVPGAAVPPRARAAAEELHVEVHCLRRGELEHRKRERRTRLEEWRLGSYRREARHVIRQLKIQERHLEESRRRHGEVEALLGEARAELTWGESEMEGERVAIRELNREAAGLREACYLPARVKRESGFLVKALDQEGGRLKTRQHLRSLEACKRLYDEVSDKAPGLLPLAGRAKAEMESEFARYLQLEEAHSRALQRLHLVVTRDIYSRDKERDGASVA